MSNGSAFAALAALWLSVSIGGGFLGARLFGGHGSIALVLFALPVGVVGAVASCAFLGFARLRAVRSQARIALVTLAASSPILLISLYAVVAQHDYPLAQALGFTAPFAGGAFAVAMLAEWLVVQHAIAYGHRAT